MHSEAFKFSLSCLCLFCLLFCPLPCSPSFFGGKRGGGKGSGSLWNEMLRATLPCLYLPRKILRHDAKWITLAERPLYGDNWSPFRSVIFYIEFFFCISSLILYNITSMVLMPRDLRGSLSSFMHYKKKWRKRRKNCVSWIRGDSWNVRNFCPLLKLCNLWYYISYQQRNNTG